MSTPVPDNGGRYEKDTATSDDQRLGDRYSMINIEADDQTTRQPMTHITRAPAAQLTSHDTQLPTGHGDGEPDLSSYHLILHSYQYNNLGCPSSTARTGVQTDRRTSGRTEGQQKGGIDGPDKYDGVQHRGFSGRVGDP
jgi:hypothetical protein